MSIIKATIDKIKGMFGRPAQPEKTEHSDKMIGHNFDERAAEHLQQREEQVREEKRQRDLKAIREAIEKLDILEKEARKKECPFDHKLQYSKTKSQNKNWGKWKGSK